MLTLFLILVIVACVALGFIILIQNPKGGGLAGNIAGFNNQFMGVKQTTDTLVKGTWVVSTIIAVLCVVSLAFMSGSKTVEVKGENIRPNTTNTAPSTTPSPAPAPQK